MTIYEKLLEIQQTVKSTKDKKNDFGGFNYRSAEGIIEDIKPILADTKTFIVLTDTMEEVGGRVYVKATATLWDAEEHKGTTEPPFIMATAYAREAVTKKGMDEAQITGAASSYARKYALSGLLLLDDNKDADTNEYQERIKKAEDEEAKAKKETPKKQEKPESLVCHDCGNAISDYQGQPASKIAIATKKKYGVPICMDCSAKRRAMVEQEPPTELPFDL